MAILHSYTARFSVQHMHGNRKGVLYHGSAHTKIRSFKNRGKQYLFRVQIPFAQLQYMLGHLRAAGLIEVMLDIGQLHL